MRKKCTDGNGIYDGCVKLEGWFGGAWANCKRQDWGYECEVRGTDKSDIRSVPDVPKVEYATRSGWQT
jgi:Protein of unknown function (DUF3716)